MKIRNTITCSLELTHDIIKGKWKLIILYNLDEGRSLSELLRNINGISEKMLLQHLNELLQYGIVGKVKSPGYPLKVSYYLEERGLKLMEAIRIFQEVGVDIEEDLERRKAIPTNK